MLVRRLPLLASTLAVVPACSSFSPPAKTRELDRSGMYWMTYDATRRAGWVIPEDAKGRILAEPAPDVAMATAAKLVAKSEGSEITAEVTQSLIELGKRTQAVMLLREGMYRLGEMTINGVVDPAEGRVLFKQILEMTKEIAIADRLQAQTDSYRAAERAFNAFDRVQTRFKLEAMQQATPDTMQAPPPPPKPEPHDGTGGPS